LLGIGGMTPQSFTPQMASALATIGGLISALVIAELALTRPGEAPAARVFTAAWTGGAGSGASGAGATGVGATGAGATKGGAPGPRAGGPAGGGTPQPAAQIVTTLYIVVWLAAGLAAFFFGYLLHADVVPALTDMGQSWLGLAVAAGYAYLGIQP
jgi:hypothetical protein